MKKYLPVLVLVGFLSFVSPAFAINDVTLTTDTIITVGGISLTVSRGSPTVDTLTVNGDSFSVLISAGATLVISSADKRVLTIPSVGSVQVSNSCLSSENVYTISNPSGASQVTVTATVSSDTCSASGNGSVGGTGGVGSTGGGGGGGGGSSVAPVVAAITAPVPATPVAPAPAVSPVFTKPLSVGSKNKDVTRLQTLLASDPSLYPEGTVSGYFGVATKKAVQKFQEKYSLAAPGSRGYGVFGPATRAKIQEVFGGQATSGTGASPVEMTTADVQAKINALMEQIKKLQGN